MIGDSGAGAGGGGQLHDAVLLRGQGRCHRCYHLHHITTIISSYHLSSITAFYYHPPHHHHRRHLASLPSHHVRSGSMKAASPFLVCISSPPVPVCQPIGSEVLVHSLGRAVQPKGLLSPLITDCGASDYALSVEGEAKGHSDPWAGLLVQGNDVAAEEVVSNGLGPDLTASDVN